MLNNTKTKIKKLIFSIESKVPYIPDFSDVWNIIRVGNISIILCLIATFIQINNVSQFYLQFTYNLKSFLPFVIIQLLILIFFSKFLISIKPLKSILFILLCNLFSVYISYSLLSNSLSSFFQDIDTTIIYYLVSFGAVFLYLIYFDWKQKVMKPASELAKLSFLLGKMKPHFLFNTINTIVSLINSKPQVAKKMLINLSDLLRVSLIQEDIKSTATIEEELSLVEKYLDIEKIRLEDNLVYKIQIEDSIKKLEVPKLFLQPLVENAVLHGISSLENGGELELKIYKSLRDKIIFELKNPYFSQVKIKQKEKKDRESITLENLKERLKIHYEGEATLEIDKSNDFFLITIELPIKTAKTLF